MSERRKTSEQFGRNLTEARQESQLTQVELARRACMHQPQISTLERGLVCPRLDSAVRLADALGVRLRDLLFEIG